MSEYCRYMRYWGLALAGIGLLGLVITVGFWPALWAVLLVSGNNLEQRAKTIEFVEDGTL